MRGINADLLIKHIEAGNITEWKDREEARTYLKLNDPDCMHDDMWLEIVLQNGFSYNGKFYTVDREEAEEIFRAAEEE